MVIIDKTQGGSCADHRHKPYGAGHRHKHVWAGYGIYGRMSVSSGFVRLASVRLRAGMISNLLEMVAFCPPGGTPAATSCVAFRRVMSDRADGTDRTKVRAWLKRAVFLPFSSCFRLFPLASAVFGIIFSERARVGGGSGLGGPDGPHGSRWPMVVGDRFRPVSLGLCRFVSDKTERFKADGAPLPPSRQFLPT